MTHFKKEKGGSQNPDWAGVLSQLEVELGFESREPRAPCCRCRRGQLSFCAGPWVPCPGPATCEGGGAALILTVPLDAQAGEMTL